MLPATARTSIPDVASESAAAAAREAMTEAGMSSGTRSDMAEGEMSTTAAGRTAEIDRRRTPAEANLNPSGRRAALQGRAIGNLPALTGLPQIVGLALGSPEFQRR